VTVLHSSDLRRPRTNFSAAVNSGWLISSKTPVTLICWRTTQSPIGFAQLFAKFHIAFAFLLALPILPGALFLHCLNSPAYLRI